jgi:hypothetical protein
MQSRQKRDYQLGLARFLKTTKDILNGVDIHLSGIIKEEEVHMSTRKKMTLLAGIAVISLAVSGATSVLAGEWKEERVYRTENSVTESAPYNMAYQKSQNPKALNSNSNFKDVTTITEYWVDTIATNPGGQAVPGQSTSELLATETTTQRVKIK